MEGVNEPQSLDEFNRILREKEAVGRERNREFKQKKAQFHREARQREMVSEMKIVLDSIDAAMKKNHSFTNLPLTTSTEILRALKKTYRVSKQYAWEAVTDRNGTKGKDVFVGYRVTWEDRGCCF